MPYDCFTDKETEDIQRSFLRITLLLEDEAVCAHLPDELLLLIIPNNDSLW